MGKNYEAVKYIRQQLSEYDDALVTAVQRLFNIEDQGQENQGCVIDSVILALIFKNFGIDTELHLGEMCADGNQDAYHCWLTLDDKVIDFGIYGNSNYNPYFRGEKLKYPIIFDVPDGIIYADGSTESVSWITQLSGMPVIDYIKHCPQNRVVKVFIKCMELPETQESQQKIYDLAGDICFPVMGQLDKSPSGHGGLYE